MGHEEEQLLQGIDLVVTSPGLPADAPLIAGAHARAIPVWSELDPFAVAVAVVAFIGLWRLGWRVAPVIAASAAAGLVVKGLL